MEEFIGCLNVCFILNIILITVSNCQISAA
jgi:hypothetical protein